MATPEQNQDERETAGFAVRTTIDDTIGKLMFIRERLLMEIPDGLHGVLHDVEATVERAVGLVDGLPDEPDWLPNSGSRCLHEGCSCGMPSWDWAPPKP